ncbi:MAG: hypothetical protein QNJ05_15615 [Woeseiaceae bacterium]|nr:hypothetical protein [Woeseiaceae bacterium]
MIRNATAHSAAGIAAVFLLASPLALSDSHNLLKDPGFDEQVSEGEGGWRTFKESRFSKGKSRSGDRAMFNWGYSRTVPYPPGFVGTVSGSYQELPAEPGSKFQLTGYGLAMAKLEGAAFGILQISFFDSEGEDLGAVETAGSKVSKAKTSNQIDTNSAVDEWIMLDTGIATAPEGTAVVHAFTLYVDYTGSNVAQGVFFDDLVLSKVED